MQISHEQLARIAQLCFDAQMIAVIRSSHADVVASVSDEDLREMIHRQRAKAAGYGMGDERPAASFVHAAWVMGDEFDIRIPTVAQVMTNVALTPLEKAQALDDFVLVVFSRLDRVLSQLESSR